MAAEALDEAHAPAGRWTSALPGESELFALHRADDVVPSMWRSYRWGAVPWVLGSRSVPGLAPADISGPVLALDALHEELLGHHAGACRLLASIRDRRVIAETSTIVRFTARRQWRPPAELLGDLADVS